MPSLMSIKEEKDIIRREIIKRRHALNEKEVRSARIIDKLRPFCKDNSTIGLYASFGDEVCLDAFIGELCLTKRIALPRIEEDEIVFHVIHRLEDCVLSSGKFPIREPRSTCQIVPKEELDLIIVPGVAFDSINYRLGYGKGYYDRFLTGYKGLKIGVCFACQKVDSLPIETHDIPLDFVLDEA